MLMPVHLIFYLFAFIALASASFVVVARNPVHSVLSLVVTFFGMAGLWMLLRAEFLSIILVLVYVGAVMTLFLFIVMMLNIDKEDKRSSFVRFLPLIALFVLALTGLTIYAVGPETFGFNKMPLPVEPANYNNLAQLAAVLYTDYAYPFEIAGVILLTAIIAAITLAHRRPHRRKNQIIGDQVAATPDKYVRLVKMPPTPPNLSSSGLSAGPSNEKGS